MSNQDKLKLNQIKCFINKNQMFLVDSFLDDLKCIFKTVTNISFVTNEILSFISSNLDYACCIQVILYLLGQNIDISYKNTSGLTAPCVAFAYILSNHNSNIVKYSDNIDERLVLDLLLSAHINKSVRLNPECGNGVSHFHLACFNGNVEVAKFFLDAGVPVNKAIKGDSSICPGYTGLHIAMSNKNKGMVELLVQYGADYNSLDIRGMSPLHLLKNRNIDDCFFKLNNFNLLQDNEILDLISKESVDNFNPIDFIGLTQLHLYCIKTRDTNNMDVFEICLDSDINANVNFNSPVWPGYTPLHFAALNNLQMVMLLLQKGANLMLEDASGITPLDLCVNKYKPSEISIILNTQTNIKSIKFNDQAILVEIIRLFKKKNKFSQFLHNFNISAYLSFDSPLWPGFTLLHMAVLLSRKSMFFIKLCLKHGADFTIQDANDMTALHLAFRLNKQKCIKVLLNSHNNIIINPIDNKNVSHFLIACIAVHEKSVKSFLESGVHPDLLLDTDVQNLIKPYLNQCSVNVGLTILHVTILLNSTISLTKLLLKFKANPNLPDADGFTWIHRSFMDDSMNHYVPYVWENIEVLKSENPVAPGKLSHFHIACYNGTLNVLENLFPIANNINEPISNELLKFYEVLPDSICSGDTPLHFAVKGCNEEAICFLIQRGADIHVRNEEGLSPLHVFLIKSKIYTYSNQVNSYITEDFYKSGIPDEIGLTRLHVACSKIGNLFLIESLLENDNPCSQISTKSPIWSGFTPLDIYIYFKGYFMLDESIELLIHQTINRIQTFIQDKTDPHAEILKTSVLTAFHYSCMGLDSKVLQKFIDFGLDLNATSDCRSNYQDSSCSALHFATYHGKMDNIRLLLMNGADMKVQSSNGLTPLHIAAKKNADALYIFCRFSSFDVRIEDAFGRSLIENIFRNHEDYKNSIIVCLKHKSTKNLDLSTLLKLINLIIYMYPNIEVESLLLNFISEYTHLDMNNQSILHYIAIEPDLRISRGGEFNSNVKFFLRNGCELDHQDIYGKTPLHLAVENDNLEYVRILLENGADTNLLDINNKTAYDLCSDEHTSFEIFNEHICKMRDAGLDLQLNDVDRSRRYDSVEKYNFRQLGLQSMQEVNIFQEYSLRDVLSQKVLMNFTLLPLRLRQEIIKYLKKKDDLREEYPDWIPIFNTQLKSILKRKELFQPAFISLRKLLDQRLPDHCLELIMIHLRTKDWSNVCKT